MKAMIKILAFALPLIVVVGCRPEQPNDPGPAYGAGDGVVGKWRQSGAVIYDLTLPVPESQEVSSFYAKGNNAWIVNFNDDGSYEVEQQGAGPSPFGATGTWAFDTAYYPTEMMITPTGESAKMVEMLNAPRATDVYFGLSYEVEKCDEVVAKYELVFTREQ